MSLLIRRWSGLLSPATRPLLAASMSSAPRTPIPERDSNLIVGILMDQKDSPAHPFPGRRTAPTVEDEDTKPPTGPSGSTPPRQGNPLQYVRNASLSKAIARARIYHLHAQCTRNNAIFTFRTDSGKTVAWASGGSVGFKSAQRSSYEAGYQCAVRMFQHIRQEIDAANSPMQLQIHFSGRGQARDALHRALLTVEGDGVREIVTLMSDRTPIKIGGTRAPKRRKL